MVTKEMVGTYIGELLRFMLVEIEEVGMEMFTLELQEGKVQSLDSTLVGMV